jgi:hypothetical protein
LPRFFDAAAPGRSPIHSSAHPWAHDLDTRPVTEEASFLEHRAALDATVFAGQGGDELVFELEAGRLRCQL